MTDLETVELLKAMFPEKTEELDKMEYDYIEELIFEKFEATTESFEKIAEKLIPFANVWVSPITDEKYSGFTDHKKGFALVKRELKF